MLPIFRFSAPERRHNGGHARDVNAAAGLARLESIHAERFGYLLSVDRAVRGAALLRMSGLKDHWQTQDSGEVLDLTSARQSSRPVPPI
jgi:hypothetical protein